MRNTYFQKGWAEKKESGGERDIRKLSSDNAVTEAVREKIFCGFRCYKEAK